MTQILEGVRILEVAEHTFVPAASALLADWGAEVIKIEHVERGDAMRGLGSTGVTRIPSDVHVLLEHANRGKQSLALDLAQPEGAEVLHRLAATCDVFLTNKLPSVREKLGIGVEAIRAHNPKIIYVRGTGQGERGPDADQGSYDSLAFWNRSGIALGVKRPDYDHVPGPPGPAFGDSIGAMTIAGGIMGALFHRERTGEPTIIDVSLLGTAIWAHGSAIALSLATGQPWAMPAGGGAFRNPLTGNYLTADGRWLAFTCLQAGRYWPELVAVAGRPELASDPRFAEHGDLLAHGQEAAKILAEVFAAHPLDHWRATLSGFSGQWTVVQDTLEAASDPQSVANGYIQECQTANGLSFQLAAAPVQFDETPARPRRAPLFNEHGDEILGRLGYGEEAVLDLKLRGVVA
jgi:crotonobetainyl-CoA:carnitine CoA-transferase CaiB-like acyl-CoA transferase